MAIIIKSDQEIEDLAEGGQVLVEALYEAGKLAKMGAEKKISTADLNQLAEEILKKRNVRPAFYQYKDGRGPAYPASLCVSLNEEVVHGIPSRDRFLKSGDVVKLDLGIFYKNLCTDSAITVTVGEVPERVWKMIKKTKESLLKGISRVKPGRRIGDYAWEVERLALKNGFSTPKILGGHGVGYEVHEEPFIPNYGDKNTGIKFKKGMVLAFEPMMNLGTDEVDFLKDGFTFVTRDREVSAHFEHTVAVTKKGVRILTQAPRSLELEVVGF